MSQGANANYSGKGFEDDCVGWLESHGFTVSKYFYEALWNNPDTRNKNSTDAWLEELSIQIECKNQNGQGTADQKFGSELWNAYKLIDCKHYVIVYGGSWWEKGRGLAIYHAAKDMAEELSTDTKQLHVFKFNEFKEWLFEQTKTGCAA
jgi:predicted heme/steroid binding protein